MTGIRKKVDYIGKGFEQRMGGTEDAAETITLEIMKPEGCIPQKKEGQLPRETSGGSGKRLFPCQSR